MYYEPDDEDDDSGYQMTDAAWHALYGSDPIIERPTPSKEQLLADRIRSLRNSLETRRAEAKRWEGWVSDAEAKVTFCKNGLGAANSDIKEYESWIAESEAELKAQRTAQGAKP